MIKKLLLIILILGSLPAAGQVKYKDLFLTFSGMSETELKSTLKEYLAQDPDHPNANFRLAMIYNSIYKRSDPLTEYAFALANAEQAKLRF
ncbi:MAG: hypothetical protein HC811_10405 [Flammeovirgaceae bacterium]|nr:hypothetical protein [Flammeovirgaceae bacterium]